LNTSRSSTPEDIIIKPRLPEFDFTEVPREWLNGPFATQFMNALSIVVPYSERTVIEIVRKYEANISDLKLKQEMEALVKQEGRHALLHIRCNSLLETCGYSGGKLFERIQKFFVGLIRKISPASWELAIPAAFEHFTSAISKEFIVNQQDWTGGKSNAAIDFTNWHALEELEHQAVCYDVFSALTRRKWILTFILLFCWMPVTVISLYGIQLVFLYNARVITKPRNWIHWLKFVFKTFPMLTRGALKYITKTYHPWSVEDQEIYHRQHNALKQTVA